MTKQYVEYRKTIADRFSVIPIGSSNLLKMCDDFHTKLILTTGTEQQPIKISLKGFCQYTYPRCSKLHGELLPIIKYLPLDKDVCSMLSGAIDTILSITLMDLAECITDPNLYITTTGYLTILPFNVKAVDVDRGNIKHQLLHLGTVNGLGDVTDDVFIRVKQYRTETDVNEENSQICIAGHDDKYNVIPWVHNATMFTINGYLPSRLLSNWTDDQTVEYTEEIPLTAVGPVSPVCPESGKIDPVIGHVIITHRYIVRQAANYLWNRSTWSGYQEMSNYRFNIAKSFKSTLGYILKKFPNADAVWDGNPTDIGLIKKKK